MDIDKLNLTQIEADVVFVGINTINETVHIQPFWECNMPRKDMAQQAAILGLTWIEQDGGGTMTVQIHDFRENPV